MFFGVFKEKEVIDNNEATTENTSDLLEDYGNAIDNPSKNDADLIPLTSFNSSYSENVILKDQKQTYQNNMPPNQMPNNYYNPNMGMYGPQMPNYNMQNRQMYPNMYPQYNNIQNQVPPQQFYPNQGYNNQNIPKEEPKINSPQQTPDNIKPNKIEPQEDKQMEFKPPTPIENRSNTEKVNHVAPQPKIPNVMPNPNMGMYGNFAPNYNMRMPNYNIPQNGQIRQQPNIPNPNIQASQNQSWDQYVESLSKNIGNVQTKPVPEVPATTESSNNISNYDKKESFLQPQDTDNLPKQDVVTDDHETLKSEDQIEEIIDIDDKKDDISDNEVNRVDDDKNVIQQLNPTPNDGENDNIGIQQQVNNEPDSEIPTLEAQMEEQPEQIITPTQNIFYQNSIPPQQNNYPNYEQQPPMAMESYVNQQTPTETTNVAYNQTELKPYIEEEQPKEEFQIQQQVDVPPGYKVCPKCGQVMRDDYKLCFLCGTYF